jgi:beta-1,4-N-acetylglucosaminyltransferase
LKRAYQEHDYFYVLNDTAILPADMKEKTYFITHSERDLKFLLNFWEAFQILRQERPKIILSTGAGPAVPFAIVGRLFFSTHVIFVETITRITSPSVTGWIMYRLAHKFFYQWDTLRPFFPKASYGGPLV